MSNFKEVINFQKKLKKKKKKKKKKKETNINQNNNNFSFLKQPSIIFKITYLVIHINCTN